MSTKTFSRYLVSSPLLAAVSYFTIMLIGGCYAKAEEKSKAHVSVTQPSPGFQVAGSQFKTI